LGGTLVTARFTPLHLDWFVPLRKQKAAFKLTERVVWQLLCVTDTAKEPAHPRLCRGQGGPSEHASSLCYTCPSLPMGCRGVERLDTILFT